MWDGTLSLLIGLAFVLSLGHHIDHATRDTHVGWPLTDRPTVSNSNLGIYPLILLGLALYRMGRAGGGGCCAAPGQRAPIPGGCHTPGWCLVSSSSPGETRSIARTTGRLTLEGRQGAHHDVSTFRQDRTKVLFSRC